ncbi:hypothetical protein Droror1_Dr00018075 [Drosera rotundifolia]
MADAVNSSMHVDAERVVSIINDVENVISAIDASSKLYLHHSDHPNYSLAGKALDGDNYGHWRRAVEVSLIAKDKLGFVTVRGNVLMMNPLPATAQAYQLLLQEEKQRDVYTPSPINGDSVAFASQQQKPMFYHGHSGARNEGQAALNSFLPNFTPPVAPRRSQFFCNYCMKSGHTIDRCFKLHGFPHGNGFGKGKKFSGSTQMSHTEESGVGCEKPEVSDKKNMDPGGSGLSSEQLNQLMGWLSKLNNTEVKVANTHVSVMADFQFNLLSASKLVIQLSENLVFTPDPCILEVPSMKRHIILGKQKRGLYLTSGTGSTSLDSGMDTVSCSIVTKNSHL